MNLNENEQAYQEKGNTKVEALRARILAECRRQGFTVYEFETLAMALNIDSGDRQREVYKELF